MAALSVVVEGDTATLPNGQVLVGVHPGTACEGRGCPIHHPTDHPMVTWPLLWRGDRGLMERTCPHGVGHPDFDDIIWRRSLGVVGYVYRALEIHGCDGCCNG